MRAVLMAAVVAVGFAGSALAGPPECTCRNLESLQQDYQNAVFLEGYMRKLAEILAAEETRLTGLKNSSNSDPDSDVSILTRTANMRDAYRNENLNLPFPTVAGYTGPESVPMPFGTCQQEQALLDAMENGSPCAAIAAAALNHERGHRDLCNALGATAYWDRLLSVKTLEEADMYKQQASDLKAELRRVLDVSKVELVGSWRHTVDAQGQMVATYLEETQSGDIGAPSGGDTWTMTGQGNSSTTIESAKIAGMNCTPNGSINHDIDVAMTTDGLTFGLETQTRRTAGDVSLKCKGGFGMSMPTNDTGSGTVATNQPLVAGDNPLPAEWAETIKAMMSAGGVTITGEPDYKLVVSCEAP